MEDFKLGLDFARELDAADPLRQTRERFYLPEGRIYMDGNSLGLCSREAEASLLNLMQVWKREAIDIWSAENGRYFRFQYRLGAMAAALIQAEANEVTIGNSTTVNIHQALASFYKPGPGRDKILVDPLNFASDRYAVDSQAILRGLTREAVKVAPSRDGRTVDEDDLIAAMTPDVALAFFPSVMYRSAQLLDMEKLSRAARERGIFIGWDLCHSIGAVPHDFRKISPDFAVFCTYKYLNGGPGATAGLYINKRHFGQSPGLCGWWGNNVETQFQLRDQYEPAPDAGAWQIGTASLLSMAPLEGALAIYNEVGMWPVREKSLKLTAYLMFLIDARLARYGFSVGNPRDDFRRGGHVALEHPEAWRVCVSLKRRGIIPDFREPDVVRLAPTALYNSYEDVHLVVDALEDIAATKEYERWDARKDTVV